MLKKSEQQGQYVGETKKNIEKPYQNYLSSVTLSHDMMTKMMSFLRFRMLFFQVGHFFLSKLDLFFCCKNHGSVGWASSEAGGGP